MTRQEQIKQVAEGYADKHGFRIPYNRSNEYYDKIDVKASLDGFINGAQWADQHPRKGLVDIEKVCDWLRNNTVTAINDFYTYVASSHNISKEEFIEQFKKAMEEQ